MSRTFACPRSVDLLALGQSAGGYEGRCLEAADPTALATRRLRCAGSLEQRAGERRAWCSGNLDELGQPRELRYDAQVHPASRAQAELEDKASARRHLQGAGAKVPKWLELFRGEADHHTLAETLGLPYVAQLRRGSGGTSTWFCHEEADLTSLPLAGGEAERILFSTFVAGLPLNIHCLVDNERMVLGAPSVQVVGHPQLSSNPAAYCGADFAQASQLPLVADALESAIAAGRMAREQGWRGILGVDLILGASGPVVLELNPRYQASTWLLAELEQESAIAPIGELHLQLHPTHGGARDDTHGGLTVERRPAMREGSTLTVRASHDTTTFTRWPTGAYTWDGQCLDPRRSCFGLRDLQSDEIFLDGAPPPQVGLVRRGAVLARATSRGTMLDAKGGLTSLALSLIRALSASSSRSAHRSPGPCATRCASRA